LDMPSKKLEDIAPKWDKKIKAKNLRKTKTMDLSSNLTCIVGEAHGWALTRCQACINFGFFMYSRAGMKLEVNPSFMYYVRKFVKHWNAAHVG
jgi:hypothetical protein